MKKEQMQLESKRAEKYIPAVRPAIILHSWLEERTPNAVLSRGCVGQRCRGWMDLGIPPIFAGADNIKKDREPGI